MPWFKVDDAFSVHPKAIKAGNKALGLWTRAGSWCAQQLTDGHVPGYVIPMLGGDSDDAEALVTVRLWDVAKDGFQFRDWSDYQPSKEAVQAERDAARERQRRAREAAKAKRHAVTSPVTHGVTNAEVRAQSRSPHPIPSHPDQNTTAPAAADVEFEEFWDQYPRKVGKAKAANAYAKARAKAHADTISNGLAKHLPVWAETEEKFIPHATTWLNGERWQDAVTAPAPKSDGPRDQWARAIVVGGGR